LVFACPFRVSWTRAAESDSLAGMPRTAWVAPCGFVNHVPNRAVARLPLFAKDADCAPIERVLIDARQWRAGASERKGDGPDATHFRIPVSRYLDARLGIR